MRALTAGDVVARIKSNLGAPWRDTTYRDTFKFGGPETPVTGIATTVFCSFDVVKQAAAAGLKAGDVLAFGHTHRPWHRVVDGVHFVNTGSVGRPKDGDWRAGYVRLDLGDGEPRVEHVRVPYDVEAAARAVLDAGLPEDFAGLLRTGGATGPVAAGGTVVDDSEAPRLTVVADQEGNRGVVAVDTSAAPD